jgi:small subunit ribosomal protein S4e
MSKNHLKRIMAPKTWPIERKATVFVTRPQPGAHPMAASMPFTILLKDLLGVTHTSRGVRFILNTQEVLVNGKRVRRPDASAGLFDVVTFPTIKTSHRILINTLNKLYAVPIAGKDATLIPCKITSKSMLPGKLLQLGFHNGRTLRVKDATYMVGGTVLLSLENKEEAYYPLEVGVFALLTGGKHVGHSGIVNSVTGSKVVVKADDASYETLKKHIFVLGKGKPAIKLGEAKHAEEA